MLACVGGPLLPGPLAGAATDPQVKQAGDELEAARTRAGRLAVDLDTAAGEYEYARAHVERLHNELDDAAATVARARAGVGLATDALNGRLTAAYMHPGSEVAMADAILLAPDAPTALHRAALLNRLVSRSARDLDVAADVSARVADAVRQERVISGGSAAAAAQLRGLAAALNANLASANDDVRSAQRGVEEARVEARRREAARRAAAAARAAAARAAAAVRAAAARAAAPTVPLAWPGTPAATPGAGAAAVPPAVAPVGGKVCPVGGTTGFIDSWGFARSGRRTHEGVDMFAEYGTPVLAVADGVVDNVYNNSLGGLAITFIDDNGDKYYYAHLSSASAFSGQRVTAGTVIAAVGTSGNAAGTPPHLHWQYHPGNGAAVNPFPLASALCR